MTNSVNTLLLMRVDKTERIMDCYRGQYLRFGCPLNWIIYAAQTGSESVGDWNECIFAQLPVGDPRLNNQVDSRGLPMRDNLLECDNPINGLRTLRYYPIILKPTLCFFSFRYDELLSQVDPSHGSVEFSLEKYCTDMGYKTEEISFLFVEDPNALQEELKKEIPIAVKDNMALSSEEFYKGFDAANPLSGQDVIYGLHKENDIFCDKAEITPFWKFARYKYQSELRFTVNHLHFKNRESSNSEGRNLIVPVPHLQEYAKVIAGRDVKKIRFYNFDNEKRTVQRKYIN